MSEEGKAYVKAFDQHEYEYKKEKYPKHMQELVKLYCMDSFWEGCVVPYVIAELLERGMLKPLRDLQKKSVLTVIAYKE